MTKDHKRYSFMHDGKIGDIEVTTYGVTLITWNRMGFDYDAGIVRGELKKRIDEAIGS